MTRLESGGKPNGWRKKCWAAYMKAKRKSEVAAKRRSRVRHPTETRMTRFDLAPL